MKRLLNFLFKQSKSSPNVLMVTFTKNAGVQGQKWKKWKEIIQILIKRSGDCQNAEIFKPKEMLCQEIWNSDW